MALMFGLLQTNPIDNRPDQRQWVVRSHFTILLTLRFVHKSSLAFLGKLLKHGRRIGHGCGGLHCGDLVIVFSGVRTATKHAPITLGSRHLRHVSNLVDACLFFRRGSTGMFM